MSEASPPLSSPPWTPNLVLPTRYPLGTIFKPDPRGGSSNVRRSARLEHVTTPKDAEAKKKAEDPAEERPTKRSKKQPTLYSDQPPNATTDKPRKRRKRPDHYKPKKRKKASAHRESTPPPTPPPSPRGPPVERLNGLINHENACFSNVLIQTLATALDAYDCDALLGEVDELLELFKLLPGHRREIHNKASRAWKKQTEDLREAIGASVITGDTEGTSPAKYLRSLLHELGEHHVPNYISPFLFQQVFAFGGQENADQKSDLTVRQQLSGDTQECPFEYFDQIMDAVGQDDYCADATMLRRIFEVSSSRTNRCYKCGYISPPYETSNELYYNLIVPEVEKGVSFTVEDMLEREHQNDDDCPKCKASNLMEATVITQFPERLILRVQRAHWDKKRMKPYKLKTLLNLSNFSYNISGTQYRLLAVMFHAGENSNVGHYVVFRKHKGKWYLLNDQKVQQIPEDAIFERIADDKLNGFTYGLLLERADGAKEAEEAAPAAGTVEEEEEESEEE